MEALKEFRRSPRLGPLVVRAEFLFNRESHMGFLTNVSEGGAFLATDAELPVGSQLPMHLSLPWQMGALAVEAVVVRRNGRSRDWSSPLTVGVGVAFVRLTPGAFRTLERFMSRVRARTTVSSAGPLRPNGERLFSSPRLPLVENR